MGGTNNPPNIYATEDATHIIIRSGSTILIKFRKSDKVTEFDGATETDAY